MVFLRDSYLYKTESVLVLDIALVAQCPLGSVEELAVDYLFLLIRRTECI